MGSRYKIGYYYERKTLQMLEKEGYIVWRTPGSHSPIDIIGLKVIDGIVHVKLIQVKSTKSNVNINNIKDMYYLKELLKHFRDSKNIDIEIWIYDKSNKEIKRYNLKNIISLQ